MKAGQVNLPRWALLLLFMLLAIVGSADAQVNRLPAVFSSKAAQVGATGKWTLREVLEIRDITETAMCGNGDAAFIMKQAFLDRNQVRYGLYRIPNGRSVAKKLIESGYIGDLSCHPQTNKWTVRGEFGAGVQLYEVSDRGKINALIVSRDLVLAGGFGRIFTALAARQTGIFAYQWAPDGKSLWYSRPRCRSAREGHVLSSGGIFFDDRTLDYMSFLNDPTQFEGKELHVLTMQSGLDRTMSFIPSASAYDNVVFERPSIAWSSDSRSIFYSNPTVRGGRTPGEDFAIAHLDVASGSSETLTNKKSRLDVAELFAIPGNRLLTVRLQGTQKHLVGVAVGTDSFTDYGNVPFGSIQQAFIGSRGQFILEVGLPGRDGLFFYPASSQNELLSQVTDDLSECSFTSSLKIGICVRQSLSHAPEIVRVSPNEGKLESVVRPDAEYDSIPALEIEREEWTNRYGATANGYVIYPRGYVKGRTYPVVCITHGWDARNKFIAQDFQWEYATQVFAEEGYLVLAVNEASRTEKTNAAYEAWILGGSDVSVAEMQFTVGLNAAATMEAALQWAIDTGRADPNRTAIAGYSRGSAVVNVVMTQSKMFKVCSSGDGGYLNAGNFWIWGMALGRGQYRGIFGGSPFDESASANYRRLSPSFRTREFAGPLLQQNAMGSGFMGLELYELLQETNVPTELVLYSGESHLFHEPVHRMAAMALNQYWMDYWLLDKRSSEPNMKARYQHWDELAKAWKTHNGTKSSNP
jgi:dipeptidyl aminopeptidase/acylaminoacyl peptidase